jgi:hypothetical protein
MTEYHASVLGHRILISELEGRIRRIEDHQDLPPTTRASSGRLRNLSLRGARRRGNLALVRASLGSLQIAPSRPFAARNDRRTRFGSGH